VSDEIHYINDVERGCVWEETLMHLPADVQMVALSATLREPEKVLHWIGSARGRPGKLARRTDRHVPLHVGAISQVRSEFVEFYGTHGDRAGIFDAQKFHALFNEKPDAAKEAAKAQAAASARGGRDAEKAARAAVNRGTGNPGKGVSQGRSYSGGGGGGGGGGFASQHKSINFEHECTLIARQLKNLDKLPAVIFCMSRKKCVEGAHAIKGLNLLVGGRPKPEPDKETDLEAWFAWSEVSQM
jgi:superfamily II RNA helicase